MLTRNFNIDHFIKMADIASFSVAHDKWTMPIDAKVIVKSLKFIKLDSNILNYTNIINIKFPNYIPH